MSVRTLNDALQRRYRSLRAQAIPAEHAYRIAMAEQVTPALPYHDGPGEGITAVFDEFRPELAEFTITITPDVEPDADLSWLGEFTTHHSPNAVDVTALCGETRNRVYFTPTNTLIHYRALFRARGDARGPAHQRALKQVRSDARLAIELQCISVLVSVHKAGILLGTASASTDITPETDLPAELARVAIDGDILDDAVHTARAALAALGA